MIGDRSRADPRLRHGTQAAQAVIRICRSLIRFAAIRYGKTVDRNGLLLNGGIRMGDVARHLLGFTVEHGERADRISPDIRLLSLPDQHSGKAGKTFSLYLDDRCSIAARCGIGALGLSLPPVGINLFIGLSQVDNEVVGSRFQCAGFIQIVTGTDLIAEFVIDDQHIRRAGLRYLHSLCFVVVSVRFRDGSIVAGTLFLLNLREHIHCRLLPARGICLGRIFHTPLRTVRIDPVIIVLRDLSVSRDCGYLSVTISRLNAFEPSGKRFGHDFPMTLGTGIDAAFVGVSCDQSLMIHHCDRLSGGIVGVGRRCAEVAACNGLRNDPACRVIRISRDVIRLVPDSDSGFGNKPFHRVIRIGVLRAVRESLGFLGTAVPGIFCNLPVGVPLPDLSALRVITACRPCRFLVSVSGVFFRRRKI